MSRSLLIFNYNN